MYIETFSRMWVGNKAEMGGKKERQEGRKGDRLHAFTRTTKDKTSLRDGGFFSFIPATYKPGWDSNQGALPWLITVSCRVASVASFPTCIFAACMLFGDCGWL